MAERWSEQEDLILIRAINDGTRTVKEVVHATADSLPNRSFQSVARRVYTLGNYRRVNHRYTPEDREALRVVFASDVSKVEMLASIAEISSVDEPEKREIRRLGPIAALHSVNFGGRQ